MFDRPYRAAPTTSVGTAYAVAFSPDGRRLAAGGDRAVTSGTGEAINPPCRPSGATRKGPISVAFSPDGRRLASGSWGGEVRIWDAGRGANRSAPSPNTTPPVSALAFSPDGRAAGHGQLRPARGRVGYDDRRAPPTFEAATDSSWASPSAPTAAPRLGRRGQDRARLGVGDRPGGARPPRAHRWSQVCGLQPRRPAAGLGRQGRDHPRLGRDPASGSRSPGDIDLEAQAT